MDWLDRARDHLIAADICALRADDTDLRRLVAIALYHIDQRRTFDSGLLAADAALSVVTPDAHEGSGDTRAIEVLARDEAEEA